VSAKRPYEQFSRHTPTDSRVAELANRQHGLVRTSDLIGLGVDTSAIAKRVTAGRLHRKYRGVYAVGHGKLSREGEFLAAVFAGGMGALLGHLALAELRGLRRYRVSLIDVVVPRNRRSEPGTRFHRTRQIHPRDRTTYKGIPVTSTPRLFVDLTEVLHPYELANVIHEAEFRGWFSPAATRDAMDRANGRHNLHVLEAALALNATGSAGLKSRNEAAFLRMLKSTDLPTPRVNVHLNGVEVDFHWPALKLAVEIRRPRPHTTPNPTRGRAQGATAPPRDRTRPRS